LNRHSEIRRKSNSSESYESGELLGLSEFKDFPACIRVLSGYESPNKAWRRPRGLHINTRVARISCDRPWLFFLVL